MLQKNSMKQGFYTGNHMEPTHNGTSTWNALCNQYYNEHTSQQSKPTVKICVKIGSFHPLETIGNRIVYVNLFHFESLLTKLLKRCKTGLLFQSLKTETFPGFSTK